MSPLLASPLLECSVETLLFSFHVGVREREDPYVCFFQVCYTQGKHIQVRVHSEVFDPLTRQHKTTNVFHYTFMSDRDVPNIIPKTYGGKHVLLIKDSRFGLEFSPPSSIEGQPDTS